MKNNEHMKTSTELPLAPTVSSNCCGRPVVTVTADASHRFTITKYWDTFEGTPASLISSEVKIVYRIGIDLPLVRSSLPFCKHSTHRLAKSSDNDDLVFDSCLDLPCSFLGSRIPTVSTVRTPYRTCGRARTKSSPSCDLPWPRIVAISSDRAVGTVIRQRRLEQSSSFIVAHARERDLTASQYKSTSSLVSPDSIC